MFTIDNNKCYQKIEKLGLVEDGEIFPSLCLLPFRDMLTDI